MSSVPTIAANQIKQIAQPNVHQEKCELPATEAVLAMKSRVRGTPPDEVCPVSTCQYGKV